MKAQQQFSLNPYTITWFTLVPLKGKVTKKDIRVINGGRYLNNCGHTEISYNNATKEMAIEKLESMKGKLTKKYKVFVYTDKQFGKRKYGAPVTSILTSKQVRESFIIQ